MTLSLRRGGSALLLLLVLAMFVGASPARAANDSHVKKLHVQIEVADSGDITVTETEDHVFPEFGGDSHGILRSIQVAAGYQDSTTTQRVYPMRDLSVSSPSGAPSGVDRERDGEYEQLRIGDPDRVVEGEQTYVVKYTLGKVVNDGRLFEEIGPEHAELVYDVVGTANEQRYEAIEVEVTGPAAASKVLCAYGPQGATNECSVASPRETSTFGQSKLSPGQGMTVSLQYPRAAFGEDLEPLLETKSSFVVGVLMLSLAVILPLAIILFVALRWWRHGRDEVYVGLTPGLTPVTGEKSQTTIGRVGTVAVQFTPPEGVQAGLVGVIIDESADTVDVTASIIELAVHGHLTIAEVEGKGNDWLLTRTSDQATRRLLPYEQVLLDGIFFGTDHVRLSSLRNTFAETLKDVQQSMVRETVDRGWFRNAPDTAGLGTKLLAMVLAGAGAGVIFFAEGAATAPFLDWLPVASNWILGGALLLTALIVYAFVQHMPARSARGSAVLAQSQGFRRYLETAEANQIRFEEAGGLFSRYLPYAIVFGCADRWAKVFDEVSAAAVAAGTHIDLPTWYIGHAYLRSGSFASLAGDIDSFAVTSAGTLTSTPASSGGSSFGGGGGFSGGGGAGSTGGSW